MYIIAIPSSQRSKQIKMKTLKFLDTHRISKFLIYIFVAENEMLDYKNSLSTEYNIIIGKEGLKENRKAISDYFNEDVNIVSIDDDVTDIIDKNGNSIKDLDYFIKDSFNYLLGTGIRMIGIYPSDNPFFYSNSISTDLKFVCGAFRMFINTNLLEVREFTLLEDYETSIKYYNHGGIARWNGYGIKANYNSMPGGLKKYRQDSDKGAEIEEFLLKYSDFCKVKKSGNDITLIKNPVLQIVNVLWICRLGNLPLLNEKCILSIQQQGYRVHLWTLKSHQKLFPYSITNNKHIVFKDVNEILKYNKNMDMLPWSDLFRYKLLYKYGGIYCDSDLFLLRRIPEEDIIISSESTMATGAFKSKLSYTAGIQVLKFNISNHILLKEVIDKIENKKKSNGKCTENQSIFKEILKKYYCPISMPFLYCPVPYWNADEIYKNVSKYSIKYGVEPFEKEFILNHSIGIHMWGNLTRTKQLDQVIEDGSLASYLLKLDS